MCGTTRSIQQMWGAWLQPLKKFEKATDIYILPTTTSTQLLSRQYGADIVSP
jgi:hypothetical protein